MSTAITIGINGFGPCGRGVLFAALQDPALRVVAINDPSYSTEYVAYLIQTEMSLTASGQQVRVEMLGEGKICVSGEYNIWVSHTHDYRAIGWGERQVHTVVECSGASTTRERCWNHIHGGATRVVIAAQSADAPVVMPGVERDTDGVVNNKPSFTGTASLSSTSMGVVCAGSVVEAVLAPLLFSLLRAPLEVTEVNYTAVHGPRPADPAAGRSLDRQGWRQARAALHAGEVIAPYLSPGQSPSTTTLTRLLPALLGRVTGRVMQVPVQRGCAIDLCLHTAHAVSKEQIDELLRTVAETARWLVVRREGMEDDYYISTDVLGHTQLFYDRVTSTTSASGTTHRLLFWTDIDCCYVQRLLDLVKDTADHKTGNTPGVAEQ